MSVFCMSVLMLDKYIQHMSFGYKTSDKSKGCEHHSRKKKCKIHLLPLEIKNQKWLFVRKLITLKSFSPFCTQSGGERKV